MLLHAAFGSVRKLSIPRDSLAEIPGHGTEKINAAYAIGGAGLMIETVEDFLGNGSKINHMVEVDFEDFPEFIDALGRHHGEQQDPHLLAARSTTSAEGFNLPKGEQELNGRQALGFARVRKNPCARRERPRPRRAPAGGAVGDQGASCSRPRRSSGCR